MRYKLLIAAMFLASGAVNAETFISNSGDEFMTTDVAVVGDAKVVGSLVVSFNQKSSYKRSYFVGLSITI